MSDAALGVTLTVPSAWQVKKDPFMTDSYGFRLGEPATDGDVHTARTAARVAVHHRSSADELDEIVDEAVATYPGVKMTRKAVAVGPGLTGVAVGPIPGRQVSTSVYVAAQGKVYQIDYYGKRMDATGLDLLSGLRFQRPARSLASLKLPDADTAVRQAPVTAKSGPRATTTAGKPPAHQRLAQGTVAAADEYQLADGCWTQPTSYYIQTSHGPTANSSTQYPGWSRMGTPNFWGERTHGNLGLGRCTSTYYTNDMYAIDYYLDAGDPLYSPFASGYVTYAGWDPGNWSDYGIMVVIRSPDSKYWSLSAHLSAVNVGVGDYVTDQTLIGWAGSTGFADPYPHVHQTFYRYAQVSEGRPYGGAGLKQTALTYLGNGGGVYTGFSKDKWVSW